MEHNNLDFTINLSDTEIGSQPKTQSEPLNEQLKKADIPEPSQKEGQSKQGSTSACSILSIDYWREYFDVTQDEIIEKVKTALNPTNGLFEQRIDAKIDLYGPFWISTTLIFCMIVIPRLWGVLLFKHQPFDIAKIGFAFTLIYGSIAAFTFIMYGLGKFFGAPVSLFKTAAIYGYGYTIFLAASFSTILTFNIITFIFTIGAGLHSTLFLLKNFRAMIEKLESTNKIIATLFIGLMQLFVTLMVYFKYLSA